jgi:hypothetical protein
LSRFKQETPQYENLVSTSPHLSPEKDPLGCCKPLTYSTTLSTLISLHRLVHTWFYRNPKESILHSEYSSYGNRVQRYLRNLHLRFGISSTMLQSLQPFLKVKVGWVQLNWWVTNSLPRLLSVLWDTFQ